jgi:uridine phosphorylase
LDEDKAVFTPEDFITYIAKTRKIPVDTLKIPERLLITYQRISFKYAKELINGKVVDWWWYGEQQALTVGKYANKEIGLAHLWIGSAAAVMSLEELIACGAKTIFEVGVAGGLQHYLHPGDIIVVTEAIRDEGTSYHYFPPDIKVESSKRLRENLVRYLSQMANIRYFVGHVWSTDGVYRETIGKLRRFRNIGVLAVNMETSAIFAVAKYRNVEAASAQIISDILSESGWLQAFETEAVRESTKTLLKAALEVLSEN